LPCVPRGLPHPERPRRLPRSLSKAYHCVGVGAGGVRHLRAGMLGAGEARTGLSSSRRRWPAVLGTFCREEPQAYEILCRRCATSVVAEEEGGVPTSLCVGCRRSTMTLALWTSSPPIWGIAARRTSRPNSFWEMCGRKKPGFSENPGFVIYWRSGAGESAPGFSSEQSTAALCSGSCISSSESVTDRSATPRSRSRETRP